MYAFAKPDLGVLQKRSAKMVVSTSSSSSSSKGPSSDDGEDSSKQGRKIAQIDRDPDVSLVHEEHDTQGRQVDQMDHDTATFEEGTASVQGTASLQSLIDAGYQGTSSAVYSRKPRLSRADKGKAIMTEQETPSKKFSKKEQTQLALDEELAQKFHEEELERVIEEERMAEEERVVAFMIERKYHTKSDQIAADVHVYCSNFYTQDDRMHRRSNK